MGFVIVIVLVVAALGGLAVWMRVMPETPKAFHSFPEGRQGGHWEEARGFGTVFTVEGPEAMARLDRIIRATPRTEWAMGSVDKGLVTYISRSLVFGFPDYVTVQYRPGDAPQIGIYSRARVGQSDLGVNKARVVRWLDALRSGG